MAFDGPVTQSVCRDQRRPSVSIAVGGMLALAAAMGIGRFVYTPILPAMADALALTKAEAGLIASANFAGYLAGALLLTLPRLPGGRRVWFIAGLIVGAATMAAMAATDSMIAFLALRFAGGVASALVLVLGSALVLDRLAEAGRSGLSAVHFAGVGLGIALSAVMVDGLQVTGAGWRALWLASALIAAVLTPICVWLVPGDAHAGEAVDAAGDDSERPARGLLSLNICHGLFGFGYVVTATFLVAAVRTAPGARVLEMLVWVVVGLAAIPSTALWGAFASRRGPLRVYGLACLIEAAGVAVGGLWSNAAGALLASVLLGGTFMGITALGFAAARGLAPAQERRAFAVMTATFGVGQIVGPIVGGWLLDQTHSFLWPSLVGAAALALASLIATRTAAMRNC